MVQEREVRAQIFVSKNRRSILPAKPPHQIKQVASVNAQCPRLAVKWTSHAPHARRALLQLIQKLSQHRVGNIICVVATHRLAGKMKIRL